MRVGCAGLGRPPGLVSSGPGAKKGASSQGRAKGRRSRRVQSPEEEGARLAQRWEGDRAQQQSPGHGGRRGGSGEAS